MIRGIQMDEGDWFRHHLESCENWETELGCLTCLFSMILQKESKTGSDCAELIEVLYRMPEHLYLYIQEFDWRFVDYMLRTTRNRTLSLEEELVEIQNRLSEYQYAQTR